MVEFCGLKTDRTLMLMWAWLSSCILLAHTH